MLVLLEQVKGQIRKLDPYLCSDWVMYGNMAVVLILNKEIQRKIGLRIRTNERSNKQSVGRTNESTNEHTVNHTNQLSPNT